MHPSHDHDGLADQLRQIFGASASEPSTTSSSSSSSSSSKSKSKSSNTPACDADEVPVAQFMYAVSLSGEFGGHPVQVDDIEVGPYTENAFEALSAEEIRQAAQDHATENKWHSLAAALAVLDNVTLDDYTIGDEPANQDEIDVWADSHTDHIEPGETFDDDDDQDDLPH
jgi:hypothetical protein